MADDILVAKHGFSAYDRKSGEHIRVMDGQTARVGHWLIDLNPELWHPLRVDYESPTKREERAVAAAEAKAKADAEAAAKARAEAEAKAAADAAKAQ